ncbi:MAG: carbonic anhydrase [Syntrophobacteraceae bacterium]
MKTKIGVLLLLLFFLPAQTTVHALKAGSGISADIALKKLLDGNRSFVQNKLKIKEKSTSGVRRRLASGQHPYAVILSCSDSRVPPEVIFDKGLGELFVVRDAGNVVNPVVLGSIEYGVEHLGATLIMVLGHSKCGAVKAALGSTGREDPNVKAIIQKISPSVALARRQIKSKDKSRLLDTAIDLNIKRSAQLLRQESPLLDELVHSGKVRIVCARYDLEEGTVRLLPCK